jgi:hypothetical protein
MCLIALETEDFEKELNDYNFGTLYDFLDLVASLLPLLNLK